MIIKICKQHGNLFEKDVIKAGKNPTGGERLRCRACMKEIHRKNYLANKNKIDAKHAAYRRNNPGKVRAVKANSFRKGQKLKIEKALSGKKRRSDKYNERIRETIDDKYCKDKLTRGTSLKFSDIPQALVDLKRATLMIRRYVKNTYLDVRMNETVERLNERKNKKY